MLTNKELKELLCDHSFDDSLKDNLSRLIDEELEKDESEMDTELIEYCLDKINELSEKVGTTDKKSDEPKHKKRKIKVKRIFLIAATITILLSSTLFFSSAEFNLNFSDEYLETFGDKIKVHFETPASEASEYKLLDTELAKDLADHGFEKVLLPEALVMSDKFKVKDIEYNVVDGFYNASIHYKYKHKKSVIFINKDTDEYEEVAGSQGMPHVKSNIKKIIVNNIPVYCFLQGDGTTIKYRDGKTEYLILCYVDLDEAVEIAKTIK